MADTPKILLIGYGNPGRLDDGLGPALAATLEQLALPNLTVEADYQLAVEHAALAAAHDVVIFADAALAGSEPFFFCRVGRGGDLSFSSHRVEPAGVLMLARDLFGAQPAGYVLAIRGYRFSAFGEALSERAHANLAAAVEFLKSAIQERGFCEVASAPEPSLPNLSCCNGDS